MRLSVVGIDTAEVERIRAGGADANGRPALARLAEGPANPCRHCLALIAEGEPKLVLAWRPFAGLHPYAEVGPIFLHARPCARYASDRVPAWFAWLEPALVRGYGRDEWIRYETGDVVPGAGVEAACRRILADRAIARVHVRSKFGCFQCAVERAAP